MSSSLTSIVLSPGLIYLCQIKDRVSQIKLTCPLTLCQPNIMGEYLDLFQSYCQNRQTFIHPRLGKILKNSRGTFLKLLTLFQLSAKGFLLKKLTQFLIVANIYEMVKTRTYKEIQEFYIENIEIKINWLNENIY